MSGYNGHPSSPTVMDMSIDAGLRRFMLGVYNKMALGLLVTAVLSYVVAYYPAVQAYFFTRDSLGRLGFTILGMVAQFAPLGIILMSAFMRNTTPAFAGFVYWAIVVCFGVSGAIWFLVYDLGSISTIFLITAASFGGLSLIGYTTKMDLRPMGSFLIMALWGIVIAGIVNYFFLKSELFDYVRSLIGVLIFAGLIAYDTQKLKSTYYAFGGSEASLNVATSYGALSLYLDFINLFYLLLRLFGNRR